MVNRINRLFFIIPAAACLAVVLTACNFLTATPFPVHLSQVMDFIDLSDELPGSGSDFLLSESRITVLDNGTSRYVFMMLKMKSGSPVLIVADEGLSFKKKEINSGFTKNIMVDMDDYFVCGTSRYNSDLSKDSATTPASGNFGISAPTSDSSWICDITSGPPDILNLDQYNTSWVSGVTETPQIDGSGNSYELILAKFEPFSSEEIIGLKFNDGDSLLIIRFPEGDLTVPSLSDPLTSGYFHFTIDDLDTNYHPHFTRDGIIMQNEKNQLILYDLNGGEKDKFGVFNTDYNLDGYDIDGKYYYVFNSQEKLLYKCRTWWRD